MSHVPTVRNPGATGNGSEFKHLRWSIELVGGQSGKKLSSGLRSKGRVAAPWIPCPSW